VGVAPDDRTVALAEDGVGVRIGDLRTDRTVTVLEDPYATGRQPPAPLVFSPDGRRLATGHTNGRVVVHDTRSWAVEHDLEVVRGGGVDALVFSPDSSTLVVGGAGTASVVDLDDRAPSVQSFDVDPLRTGAGVSVGVRDGGRTVATVTSSTQVMLWDVDPEDLLAQACRVAGRDLTAEEWDRALPGRTVPRTCSGRRHGLAG
jgi:WD40 repeat protein